MNNKSTSNSDTTIISTAISNTTSNTNNASTSNSSSNKRQRQQPQPSTSIQSSLVYDLTMSILQPNGTYQHVPIRETRNGHHIALVTVPSQYIQSISVNSSSALITTHQQSQCYNSYACNNSIQEIELLLDTIISPILRKSGNWKINSNLTTFRFKNTTTTTNNNNNNSKMMMTTIRRKQMITILQNIQPLLQIYGNAFFVNGAIATTTTGTNENNNINNNLITTTKNQYHNNHTNDGFTTNAASIIENLILEHFLTLNIQRWIDIDNELHSSIIDYSNDNNINKDGIPNHHDHVVKKIVIGYSFLPNKRRIMKEGEEKDVVEEMMTKRVKKTKSMIRNVSTIPTSKNNINDNDNETQYIQIVQLLPKFYPGKIDKPFLTNYHNFINDIESNVLKDNGDMNEDNNNNHNSNHEENNKLLKMKIVNVRDDPCSIALIIKGRIDYVENTKRIVAKRINRLLAKYNVREIMNHTKSYEVNIPFKISSSLSSNDIATLLGVTCISQYEPDIPGLWITRGKLRSSCDEEEAIMVNNGIISKMLGSGGISRGAVLEKIKLNNEWHDLFTLKHRNAVFRSVRNVNKSNSSEEIRMIAKVYLSHEVSLDALDQMSSKGLKITRRDGSIYGTLERSSNSSSGIGSNNKLPKKRRNDDVEKEENTKSTTSVAKTNTSPQKKQKKGGTHRPDDVEKILPQKKQKKGGTYRQHFVEKMKGVAEIEFRKYKIDHRIINQSMWNAHIKLFGNKCQESCECPSKVDFLTKDVLREYITEKENADVNWVKPLDLQPVDSMIGFSNNFCTKFYKKVRERFPTDTPYQTLKRLLSMWKDHTQQRRFGITCKDDCCCGDIWEALFLKTCINCFKDEKKTKKHSDDTSNTILEKEMDDNGKIRTIIIRPSKTSFGLFFVDKDGYVVVSSVDPNGFTKRKINSIKVGSKVTGVSEDGSKMQPVQNVKELENKYTFSKQVNHKLKVWFSLEVDTVDNSNEVVQKWTPGGAWLGISSEIGWAGGSSVVTSYTTHANDNHLKRPGTDNLIDNIANVKKDTDAVFVDTVDDYCNRSDVAKDMNEDRSKLEWSQETSGAQSILRHDKNKRPSLKKKVSINESRNQVFNFIGNTVPALQTRRNVSQERQMEAAKSPKQPFDVFVQFLKQTHSRQDFMSLSNAIQSEIVMLQDCAKETDYETEYNTIEKDLRILKQKKSALLIFMMAKETVDLSIHVNEAFLLVLSPSRININVTESLYCSLYVNDKHIGSTSKVAHDKFQTWPSSTELSILYSKSVDEVEHVNETALIELRKGSPTGDNSFVGKAPIKLPELISHHSTHNSESVGRSYELLSHDNEKVGTILLKHKILNAPNEMLTQRRLEIAEKLKVLIFLIKKFRIQYPDMLHLLSADIKFDNVSLLHVAITSCDCNILRELIQLGAQTEFSVVDYARNLVKRRDLWRGNYHEMIQILSSHLENNS